MRRCLSISSSRLISSPAFCFSSSPYIRIYRSHRFLSAATTNMAAPADHNNVEAFHKVLGSSRRILALTGAGLSASSGLATFRGPGGFWRNYDATKLATMDAFTTDPGLVWLFYNYRRHMALKADPNPAHFALAALAKQNPEFVCLTQNVDNLSQRANHPESQLYPLHGSLFNITCSEKRCTWIQHGNFDDPFSPLLAEASRDVGPGETLPLLDPYHRLDHIPAEELPKCPKCAAGLQRPGVVWFGEALDEPMMVEIDLWVHGQDIDLMLVIGTSAKVFPAAGYIAAARGRGAKIVVVNPEAELPDELKKLNKGDFAFGQDAATCLPILLEPIIGTQQPNGEFSK